MRLGQAINLEFQSGRLHHDCLVETQKSWFIIPHPTLKCTLETHKNLPTRPCPWLTWPRSFLVFFNLDTYKKRGENSFTHHTQRIKRKVQSRWRQILTNGTYHFPCAPRGEKGGAGRPRCTCHVTTTWR